MSGRTARVTFHPLNRARDIRVGATILAAANQCGVPVGQSCSGEGICGWCRVTVVSGAENLMPPTDVEAHLIDEKKFAPDERAACLAKVNGNLTVTTSYW
ncbi:MAG TPA: 2Fe-2S iron-sulfur cluster-binding protein [Bacteroidota bacterium]|nr:2Fe-2S iron-sulfur cluster-binding protein [Bacteroidota bacterium]